MPKLANKLKTFGLHNVLIDHSCVHGIAQLMNTSLSNLTLEDCKIPSTDFDSLTTAIATSKLKHLKISYYYLNLTRSPTFGINLARGQSLAKLLTKSKTLEEVTVHSDYPNICNVVRLLVEAMTHSSVKKLKLKAHHYCDVSDIHYDRDRVEVLTQNWTYI